MKLLQVTCLHELCEGMTMYSERKRQNRHHMSRSVARNSSLLNA